MLLADTDANMPAVNNKVNINNIANIIITLECDDTGLEKCVLFEYIIPTIEQIIKNTVIHIVAEHIDIYKCEFAKLESILASIFSDANTEYTPDTITKIVLIINVRITQIFIYFITNKIL